ncbi:hypothetical protein PTSG_05827 [Salpingoeca rosetta]|uniref:Uncharacterized protein n=1 Tax=Salpingoeca rosetta (strain ATCC 50818 / BSB-021) TaxID=946362 RepID=F2UCW8_SALR5|nr:uncharacterized protein PTSG_05827 [Salpingoeca rosetta]EGD74463.1 hypothetical protein PTSG_05827 [Salpingoeca rosetta]|eukprot:XP_004992720.1 hypothetical protein PTSG_05827 [Salpingoeca rosetta]
MEQQQRPRANTGENRRVRASRVVPGRPTREAPAPPPTPPQGILPLSSPSPSSASPLSRHSSALGSAPATANSSTLSAGSISISPSSCASSRAASMSVLPSQHKGVVLSASPTSDGVGAGHKPEHGAGDAHQQEQEQGQEQEQKQERERESLPSTSSLPAMVQATLEHPHTATATVDAAGMPLGGRERAISMPVMQEQRPHHQPPGSAPAENPDTPFWNEFKRQAHTTVVIHEGQVAQEQTDPLTDLTLEQRLLLLRAATMGAMTQDEVLSCGQALVAARHAQQGDQVAAIEAQVQHTIETLEFSAPPPSSPHLSSSSTSAHLGASPSPTDASRSRGSSNAAVHQPHTDGVLGKMGVLDDVQRRAVMETVAAGNLTMDEALALVEAYLRVETRGDADAQDGVHGEGVVVRADGDGGGDVNGGGDSKGGGKTETNGRADQGDSGANIAHEDVRATVTATATASVTGVEDSDGHAVANAPSSTPCRDDDGSEVQGTEAQLSAIRNAVKTSGDDDDDDDFDMYDSDDDDDDGRGNDEVVGGALNLLSIGEPCTDTGGVVGYGRVGDGDVGDGDADALQHQASTTTESYGDNDGGNGGGDDAKSEASDYVDFDGEAPTKETIAAVVGRGDDDGGGGDDHGGDHGGDDGGDGGGDGDVHGSNAVSSDDERTEKGGTLTEQQHSVEATTGARAADGDHDLVNIMTTVTQVPPAAPAAPAAPFTRADRMDDMRLLRASSPNRARDRTSSRTALLTDDDDDGGEAGGASDVMIVASEASTPQQASQADSGSIGGGSGTHEANTSTTTSLSPPPPASSESSPSSSQVRESRARSFLSRLKQLRPSPGGKGSRRGGSDDGDGDGDDDHDDGGHDGERQGGKLAKLRAMMRARMLKVKRRDTNTDDKGADDGADDDHDHDDHDGDGGDGDESDEAFFDRAIHELDDVQRLGIMRAVSDGGLTVAEALALVASYLHIEHGHQHQQQQ